MFCRSCGSEIEDNSKFCCVCGKAVEIYLEPHANNRMQKYQPADAGISLSLFLNVILTMLAVCLAVVIVVASVYLKKEDEKSYDYDIYETVSVEIEEVC